MIENTLQAQTNDIKLSPFPKSKLFQDITGKKFGRLTAIGYRGRTSELQARTSLWWFRCECGNVTLAQSNNVKNGHTSSCGCFAIESAKANATHGMRHTGIYNCWVSLRARCYNPKATSYPIYGGRGIEVCERWRNSFENFYEDMGPRPTGKSIDRINVNGNYEPSNCRWATQTEQGRNTTVNRIITHSGRSQCLQDWADETGISRDVIYSRIKLGWSVEEAITTPVQYQKRKVKALVR